MLNALLTVAICASVVHSAALPGFDFPDYQQGLLNGFDFSFGMLKQDYLTKISKLKREAKECSLTASCSKFTEKIEVSYKSNLLILLFFRFFFSNSFRNDNFLSQLLNKLFRHDAEKMKDLHEQSMQMFHRRNYIRCIDCIVDYLDAMFDEFCDTMDDVQNDFNGLCDYPQNFKYFIQS